MPGGRRIPVTVEADTHGNFNQAADGLEKVALKAEEADASLGRLTKGHQALDAEIDKTAYSIKNLRSEFEKTGNIDLLKDAQKLDRTRKSLEKLRNEFGMASHDVESFAKAGGGLLNFAFDEWIAKAAKSTKTGIMDGLNSLSGIAPTGFMQWLVFGAVAAAPAIGAALNSALLLAIGGGGIAAGIIGAIQDPRVKAAWGGFGDFVKSGLADASSAFVVPMERAAATARATLSDLFRNMSGGLDALAPSFTHLVDGLAGMLTRMDLGSAFASAAPVVNQLADDLPGMGDAMHAFFADIAAGGPGAVAFMHDFDTAIEVTVVNLGLLIESLSKVYDFVRNNPFGEFLSPVSMFANMLSNSGDKGKKAAQDLKVLSDSFSTVGDSARNAGLGIGLTANDFSKLSGQINATRQDSDALAGSMVDKLLGSMVSMDQATLGFAQAQTQLSDSIKQNGRELDIHTAKGEANRSAILGVVQSNIAQYDALMRSGAGAEQAAAAYDANTAALEAQLRKAGFTQQAIDGLIGKYRGVPKDVDTNIATYGLTEAINGLNDAIRLANHLDGRVSVLTIEERHRTTYDNSIAPQDWHGGLAEGGFRMAGGIKRAAVGMLIPPSDPGTVLTGEPQTGGEALIPFRGIRPERAAMLGRTVLSGYGYDVVPRVSGYASPVVGGRDRSSNPRPANASAQALDPHTLARAVASALSGMAVVMDGQTVGRIQGRQALLLERGG